MTQPSEIDIVSHQVTRLTVHTGADYQDFLSRYEEAVPPLRPQQIAGVTSWPEMLALVDRSAPFGFLIYSRIEVLPVMSIAGHSTPGTAYLMGNHTIAERMFRHDPNVMLHAPLRTFITAGNDGTADFTIDQPSTLFASYGRPEIAEVGRELDGKVAVLLAHLGAPVPPGLLSGSDSAVR